MLLACYSKYQSLLMFVTRFDSTCKTYLQMKVDVVLNV